MKRKRNSGNDGGVDTSVVRGSDTLGSTGCTGDRNSGATGSGDRSQDERQATHARQEKRQRRVSWQEDSALAQEYVLSGLGPANVWGDVVRYL